MTVVSGGAVGWHDQIAERFNQSYQRSAGFIERRTLWSRLIEAHVGPHDTVLDAGCGAGTFSLIAATRAKAVAAFDGSPAMIAIGERARALADIANVKFEVALLDSLDRSTPEQFDVVLSSSVLEYVDDLERELARVARVLKPGGRLIVSMPNADSLYRKIERLAFRLTGRPRYFAHVRNVPTMASLTRQLEALGLRVVECEYFADPPGLAGRVIGNRPRDKTLFVIVARKG